MLRRFSPSRLTEHREAKGLSRQDLADATHRTPWTVYAWEAGKAAPPANMLALIADVLELHSIDLLYTVDVRDDTEVSA